MYTFDENTLSDLHKDARGSRPRSDFFWDTWNQADNDGKQAIWDGLVDEMVERGDSGGVAAAPELLCRAAARAAECRPKTSSSMSQLLHLPAWPQFHAYPRLCPN